MERACWFSGPPASIGVGTICIQQAQYIWYIQSYIVCMVHFPPSCVVAAAGFCLLIDGLHSGNIIFFRPVTCRAATFDYTQKVMVTQLEMVSTTTLSHPMATTCAEAASHTYTCKDSFQQGMCSCSGVA